MDLGGKCLYIKI